MSIPISLLKEVGLLSGSLMLDLMRLEKFMGVKIGVETSIPDSLRRVRLYFL